MSDNHGIEQGLAQWDGKSKEHISRIYMEHHQQDYFLDSLFHLLEDAPYQEGASWLLKTWLEDLNTLSERQVTRLIQMLLKFTLWPSVLHSLQCLPWVAIPSSVKARLFEFLRDSLASENKFIKAWSYGGLCELAAQYPEYQAEVKTAIELALKSESASVTARIRRYQKCLDWL